MNLGIVLDVLRKFCSLSEEMMMVGGGSRSSVWRRIFADVYNMDIVKTKIGEDAGSLGAAAVGAVGSGMWKDFSRIDDVHRASETVKPVKADVEKYRKIRTAFECLRNCQKEVGELLHSIELS